MKNLKSWVLTFIVWTLLFWWESSSHIITSKMWKFQFFIAWLYLISATVYVPPHKNVEIHNRLIGGKLFDLNSGFYLFPLVMWWGAIYKPKESNLQKPNTPHIYLDSRDLKEVVDDFNKKNVRRERHLTGFWGAFEDFTRQYFGNLNLKDFWWIFVVTGILALQLANYSIWFTKKFYPENFKAYETKVVNNNNSNNNSQNQAYNLNNSSKSTSTNSNSDQNNFQEKEDVNALDREKTDIDISNDNWYPNESFDEDFSYDCSSVPHNNYVACKKNNIGENSVRISGYFCEGMLTGIYIPKFYVDGYLENASFNNFFYVIIHELHYKDGLIIKDRKTTMSNYIDVIKTSVDYKCYRDIEYVLKDQFKDKVSWLVLDAGFKDPVDDINKPRF